jgi:hypothetical protein
VAVGVVDRAFNNSQAGRCRTPGRGHTDSPSQEQEPGNGEAGGGLTSDAAVLDYSVDSNRSFIVESHRTEDHYTHHQGTVKTLQKRHVIEQYYKARGVLAAAIELRVEGRSQLAWPTWQSQPVGTV